VLVYFHWKVEPQVGHEKKARLEGSRESAGECDAARKGLGLEGEEGRGSDAGAGGRRQNEDKKERDKILVRRLVKKGFEKGIKECPACQLLWTESRCGTSP